MPSLLLLLACTEPAAPDLAIPPEPAPVADPQPVAASEAGIAVQPVSIGWDAERGAIEVEVRLTGEALATRTEPVYVGVTVITASDREVDLLVHTLFPGSLDQSLQFVAELPQRKAPKHVLIGAWNTKVEPCAVDRQGCKEFGFVLDDSLASFPGRLYDEGMRQRFLPASYAVGVVGDPAQVSQPAGRFAAVFGASVQLHPVSSDRGPGVWVGAADDLGFAWDLAQSLGQPGAPLPYGQVEGLSQPMVVVLP